MKKIKYILLFKHCLTKPKNLRGAAKQMVMIEVLHWVWFATLSQRQLIHYFLLL